MGSDDVGKELPRNKSVLCGSLWASGPMKHHRKGFQDACLFRGYPLGSNIVVRGGLHSTPPFLRLERVIRSRWGWFRLVRGTRSTNRVTCDLSSVGKQEGNNQMTQDTVKCPDRQLYTDISACYM